MPEQGTVIAARYLRFLAGIVEKIRYRLKRPLTMRQTIPR
jgi:hypothetical protein